jgi:Ca-activated chloride channel family protein
MASNPGAQSQVPGLADLLGQKPQAAAGTAAATSTPGVDPEDRQAIEQLLRRVEDDPAGLLRQRFLLQHLRRTGQLP